ncbi:hypothetical protein V5F32_00700 [Xanthobacter oligotrophicus]|uniref:Helix-turn-helix domain-containing protein n=1 Tax=Xanthobacter oligotrophicus TaxID=2607286 RepID=A0ABW6ZPM3_9HYPH
MSRPIGQHLDSDTRTALRRLLAGGASISAAAREAGVARGTARREARLLDAGEPVGGEEAPAPEPAQPFRLGGSPESRRIVQLEDEVKRLRGELRAAHRAALDEEAVREILGTIAHAAEEPPDWVLRPAPKRKGERTAEVPVCTWSDWHMGEVVSRTETNGVNAFDLTIAETRIRALMENIIRIARDHGPGRYPGIVINLLGDIVSGGLHPELAKTDALEVLPAALRARDILVWAFERMIEAFGHVYVPCAAGNHGRNTLKPEYKRYIYKNYDWLIYELLVRHFSGRPEIRFDIRESNEVRYRVFGQRYLAMHGDMLGVKGGDGIIGSIGPIMRGEVKTRGQAASSGRDYDVLVIGHWHQELWLPRAIVANALKGFDEFARLALRAIPSEPSQPLWFVHPRRGITSRWNVRVEAPPERAGVSEWVSWEPEV